MSERDKARYLGARNNCGVVESLADNPDYGPNYQIVRYGSVNFWYKFLKESMGKSVLGKTFGAEVDLKEFGGIGKHDEQWVPGKWLKNARGPATFHAFVLPRQIIDIISKNGDPQKKAKLAFQAVEKVLASRDLDEAVVSLAVMARKKGMHRDEIRKRVFDSGYKEELPGGYWKPIFSRINLALQKVGI